MEVSRPIALKPIGFVEDGDSMKETPEPKVGVQLSLVTKRKATRNYTEKRWTRRWREHSRQACLPPLIAFLTMNNQITIREGEDRPVGMHFAS